MLRNSNRRVTFSDEGNDKNEIRKQLLQAFRTQRQESTAMFYHFKSDLTHHMARLEHIQRIEQEKSDAQLKLILPFMNSSKTERYSIQDEDELGSEPAYFDGRFDRRRSYDSVIRGDNRAPSSVFLSIVETPWFVGLSSFIILLNAVTSGFQAEFLVTEYARDPNYVNRSMWRYVNGLFSVFFAFELLIRVAAYRSWFFVGKGLFFNYLDCFLVFQSFCMYFFSSGNFQIVRVLRLLRFARVLRAFRVAKMFHSFQLMVFSLSHSFEPLAAVMIGLVFCLYAFTLLFMCGLQSYLRYQLGGSDPENYTDIIENYGTLSRSLGTLFDAIAGGADWEPLAQPLSKMGGGYTAAFYFFIFFMLIGVFNVVTSVFVDTCYRASTKDPELSIQQEMRSDQLYTNKVKEFLQQADEDGSGKISYDEFLGLMGSTQMQAYLNHLELDSTKATTIFKLLDTDQSGDVDVDELAQGCARLKGDAKKLDLCVLRSKLEFFKKYVEDEFRTIHNFFGSRGAAPTVPSTFTMLSQAKASKGVSNARRSAASSQRNRSGARSASVGGDMGRQAGNK